MKTYFTRGYYKQAVVGTIAELIKWIEEDTGCNVSYDVDQHSNPILVGNEVYRDENGFTITLHECLIIANEVKG